ASESQRHEDNGAGYCAYCDIQLKGVKDDAYCPAKGYYTAYYPLGLKSVSAWKKLGYKLRKGQEPAGVVYGQGLPSARQWYKVYSIFQMEKTEPKSDAAPDGGA